MTDYYGMAIGVSIALLMFACMLCSHKIFSVTDEQYEKIITEHGDDGLRFLLNQKRKYGRHLEVNKSIIDKMKQAKLEEYYSTKDRKAKEKYDREFDKRNNGD